MAVVRNGNGRVRLTNGWTGLSDSQLLSVQFCDLGLRLKGTWLQECIDHVQGELADRGLKFRPHFWLSSEWFTPFGVGGSAIPFFLAHPRLRELERRQMYEVEGGTRRWCVRLLRHEVGHAIDNAFQLRRRRRRERLFGRSKKSYPRVYFPDRTSRDHVLHLDSWYAQSHPDEDFAETFALWLESPTTWRRRYGNWPALAKLEYMDELMQELRGKAPVLKTKREVEPLTKLQQTLGAHYRRKCERYGIGRTTYWDRGLRGIFSDDPQHHKKMTAYRLLRKINSKVCLSVSQQTGESSYTVENILKDMTRRVQELDLRVRNSESKAAKQFANLLSEKTGRFFQRGSHSIIL